jgi:hypothetical protein
MDVFLWILQGLVSLGGIGAFLIILHPTLKEYGIWGLWLFFPPVLILYPLFRWKRFKYPYLVFIACFVAAALLQRARLGYWDWPDVEQAV